MSAHIHASTSGCSKNSHVHSHVHAPIAAHTACTVYKYNYNSIYVSIRAEEGSSPQLPEGVVADPDTGALMYADSTADVHLCLGDADGSGLHVKSVELLLSALEACGVDNAR